VFKPVRLTLSRSVSLTLESETAGHVRGQLWQMAVESCGGQLELGEGGREFLLEQITELRICYWEQLMQRAICSLHTALQNLV
jgi:hypothetical protein